MGNRSNKPRRFIALPKLQLPKKLYPLLKPKKFKIVYGGRGGAKSMSVADLLLMRIMTEGIKVGAMREMMNSIDDSVHSLFISEINRLNLQGFTIQNNAIYHESGGEIKYKGLARNAESVKSMHGFDVFWVEEAATLSKKSIDLLIPTLREEGAEIWFTFNPGSSADPVSKEFIEPFKTELEINGCYFDDMYTIIKINYTDNPFFPKNLNDLRIKHKEIKPEAEYMHIWEGEYSDSVEGAIIKVDWFNACIDAHKIDKLKNVFKPHGAIIAAHDPSDTGNDDKGYAVRHGSIILAVKSKSTGEVDEGCDWATGLATQHNANWFVWDGDGLGAGLKRQVSTAFSGTSIKYHMFRGSLSGIGQDNAKKIYQPQYGDDSAKKTYAETFKNNRAQYYTDLATRCYNTYRCVVKGEYVDPDDMISFDSDGIDNIPGLRSEICRIPKKDNPNGLIQIMNKKEMKLLDIDSPNEADSVMMCLFKPVQQVVMEKLNYPEMSIV